MLFFDEPIIIHWFNHTLFTETSTTLSSLLIVSVNNLSLLLNIILMILVVILLNFHRQVDKDFSTLGHQLITLATLLNLQSCIHEIGAKLQLVSADNSSQEMCTPAILTFVCWHRLYHSTTFVAEPDYVSQKPIDSRVFIFCFCILYLHNISEFI